MSVSHNWDQMCGVHIDGISVLAVNLKTKKNLLVKSSKVVNCKLNNSRSMYSWN